MIAWRVDATPFHVVLEKIHVIKTQRPHTYMCRDSGTLYTDKIEFVDDAGKVGLMYFSRSSAKLAAQSYAQMQVNYWTERLHELRRP